MTNLLLAATFLAAVGLAAVHLFSTVLRVLDGLPRHQFLSTAGGMAVTFVFLQLLPALRRRCRKQHRGDYQGR